MAAEEYDGIILGAGHNALVLQACLARRGLSTLCVERRESPGGGLATVENPRLPGFLHNTHSFFHRAITAMPWFRELEMERHGVRYVEPELNVALLLDDGRALEWWTDLERTAASFAEFSRRDAAALRAWAEEFRPIVETFLIPESRTPPLPPEVRRERLQGSRLGRRLLEVSELSPLEFVEREFENDAIRAGLLFFNGLREVDLRLRGFGHAIPALLASPHKAQMCIGGAAELARGLVRDIAEHGGEVRCGVEIERIVIEAGRASAIDLRGGGRIRASRFIASGLNPQQTFLDLLEGADIPPPLRDRARGYRYNLLAPLFAVNAALSEPPRYAAAAGRPELDHAFMVILGLDGVDKFHRMVRAHEEGNLPPPVAWGACPTLFDPGQAPPGKHTAFLWEKLPYSLRGRPEEWDGEKARHAEELLRFWTRHAPNLEGAVLDAFASSPLDTERAFPNMARGDLLIGSFAEGQTGAGRPFPAAGGYRTPVPGLYLCGGCTHPGGNITGLCGYNAAGVIASDLRLPPAPGA